MGAHAAEAFVKGRGKQHRWAAVAACMAIGLSLVAGSTPAAAAEYESTVTAHAHYWWPAGITYSLPPFPWVSDDFGVQLSGQVSSSEPECVASRRVAVYRTRLGTTVQVGVGVTEPGYQSDGWYAVTDAHAPPAGEYFARALPKTIDDGECEAATSDVRNATIDAL